MKISDFQKLLKTNAAIQISPTAMIFDDFELWNPKTDKSTQYDSLEALLKDNPEVADKIEAARAFYVELRGGRGADAGGMGGGFSFGRNPSQSRTLQNANLNFNTAQRNSLEDVIERFKGKYGTSDREYGASIDEEGFVHRLAIGQRGAVQVEPLAGQTIVHNHPNGSAFSGQDLLTVASTGARGVVALSSSSTTKGDYYFRKTSKFRAKDFIKAIRKAQWPKNLNYNEGVDWWLRKNQQTYGYTYRSTKG